MRQRGRKSPEAVAAVINVSGERLPLTAPASLTNAEQTLFNELTAACDPSHFHPSDIPLLISYVQATLMSQAAAHDPDKVVIWEKSTRLLATLATRLRLAPQSRVDPKSLGRVMDNSFSNLRKPWEAVGGLTNDWRSKR